MLMSFSSLCAAARTRPPADGRYDAARQARRPEVAVKVLEDLIKNGLKVCEASYAEAP